MSKYPKRLIEVDLPIRAISAHARRDQNIRKGHLHTMHVWWATRPLASCRAVLMATMLPDPADEACPEAFLQSAREEMQSLARRFCTTKEGQGELIVDLKKDFSNKKKREAARQEANRRNELWERLHKEKQWTPDMVREALLEFIAWGAGWEQGVLPTFLDTARNLVAAAHPDGPPLVLDPFAGAGSIPFEALRVGAQAFAGDLNPVAVLLNKVALEYLPKYGERLGEGVKKWGKSVLDQARKKLEAFYPKDSQGNIPLAYIWARTIQCEGPGCGAEVPLLGLLWLSNKKKKLAALRYQGVQESKEVVVEVYKPKSERDIQLPITNRMAATCPLCGYTTAYKNVRAQISSRNGGTCDSRMLATIMLSAHGARIFRESDDRDIEAASAARRELDRLQSKHDTKLSVVPDEPLPPDGTLGYRINKYGMKTWADVYLPRQTLTLATFCGLVSEAHRRIVNETGEAIFADAVATCLALAIGKTATYNASTSFVHPTFGMQQVFLGSAFPMKCDFAEANPLMPKYVGGLDYALGLVVAFLERENSSLKSAGSVQQISATDIPLPDDSVAYLVTDPPYYDAIPYAALSDFCYVWLKRAVGSLHADLFGRELTPKAEECILDPGPPADGGPKKDKGYFEKTMEQALAEGRRALRPDGVGVVIFAHKGTAGWEALLKALVSAAWMVTASWPIDTERQARWRAVKSATLSSSVHLVCRPRENPDGSLREAIGDWRDVLAELPQRIHEWMPRLAAEGVVGADAIFACLGPALEVFSRYSRVEKASGQQVPLREYLEHVWAAVSQEALRMVFEGADATGFEEDARLTAMWLWTLKAGPNGNGQEEDAKAVSSGGYVLEYDAARKIAQGLGAHLEKLPHVVEIVKDKARLLPVEERDRHLFGKAETAATTKRKKKRQRSLFEELDEAEVAEGGWGEGGAPTAGQTTLDRVHQAMLLFASGRSAALKRFLVEEGIGRDSRFWTLAQALSALYPSNTQEKRWVDGLLARKKGLGF